MQDRLLIATKVKKTIEYIDKIVVNYPASYVFLKNKIIGSGFELLELVYIANMYKDINSKKNIIIKIKMLDYYLKISADKQVLSYKKYEQIGYHLLEINKMVSCWIANEKSK